MLNKILNFALLLISINLTGQEKLKFQSKSDYLTFMNDKFSIEKSDLYYFDAVNDSANIGRISILIFMKGTMMSTVDEIREKEGNLCNNKKFMELLTIDRINNSLTENKSLASSFYRNIQTNEVYNTENQLTAIFLFSYQFGKNGLQYIKHKKYLEDLNIKCIILTLDESEIKGISNEKSTKLVKAK